MSEDEVRDQGQAAIPAQGGYPQRPMDQAPPAYPAAHPVRYPPAFPATYPGSYPGMPPMYRTGAYPFPPPATPRKSRTGLVIAGLVSLVGVTGLVLGVLTYNNDKPARVTNSSSTSNGTVTQDAMCQTIAVASDSTGPGAVPTMPGGAQDLSAMQAAEAQVYQWAQQTQDGRLKDELEQENADAQQFIEDYDDDPDADSITPTGVLSIDMSTFTIDQTRVDKTCGISTTESGAVSV
ncbi:MAG TPA: hypothetical protein VGX23_21995 [Actinocrinis sp.]|nr:hypothetical protein [Actinocrinis sp.]